MRLIRNLLFIGLLVFLFGCPDSSRRSGNQDAGSTYGGGPSVYDDSSSSAENVSDETEVVEESIPAYTNRDTDDVDSEKLDILDDTPGTLDWEPVYFDFDKASLREEARTRLTEYAEILKRSRNIKVLIEGHCDTRGTEAYNQALGERRAETVRRFFRELGVSELQLSTISYGELQPRISGENEAAWRQNRRVEFRF